MKGARSGSTTNEEPTQCILTSSVQMTRAPGVPQGAPRTGVLAHFHGLTPRGDAGGVYIDWLVGPDGPEEIVKSVGRSHSDSAQPWTQLAPDYERARSRDD